MSESIVTWTQSELENGADKVMKAIAHSCATDLQVRIEVKTIMFFLDARGTLRNLAESVASCGAYLGTGWRVSLAVPPDAKEKGWFYGH